MADQHVHTHQLDNGLTLLVEPMRAVQSASFSLSVPAGVVYEDDQRNGTSAILCDLMTRGAGNLNTRMLSDKLDHLGLQRGESVGWNHMSFSGATLAENLIPALDIYADIVQRPRLPEDEFEPVVAGVRQSLRATEDEPRQKVIIELRKRCYDSPWGRPTDGSLSDLPNVSYEHVRQLFDRSLRPNGAILGIAGNVDVETVQDAVERAFSSWEAGPAVPIVRGERGPARDHITSDSNQTHIGLAYDSVPYRDDDYYTAWAAVSILSGGSSSRLFTEVRERRGLCYSVYATLNSLLEEGRVLAYAGTTPERAQETLDVTVQEIRKLNEGIDESELDRVKAGAKSALIMQQESTGSRASSLVRDWFHLRRTVPLDEVHRRIDSLTVGDLLRFVSEHPPLDFTLLTIGPVALEVPDVVS
ncbi:MAG: insulinase family protein [Planctomycetaceae bacterium]|nr:insulinase family protein [Planctomycetaceae bacterium]